MALNGVGSSDVPAAEQLLDPVECTGHLSDEGLDLLRRVLDLRSDGGATPQRHTRVGHGLSLRCEYGRMDSIDPVVARRTWRTLEPIHGVIYFAPEAVAAYAAIGLTGPSGYFASRAAAMGSVSADMIAATFFNFHPGFVRRAMRGVWDTATPQEVTAARYDAADRALRRAGGDLIDSLSLREAAALARVAALAAAARPEGRLLFAAHAALAWPDAPHLVLWHAQTLLREFRGDGHIAALVLAGLSGLDSLVLHAATGEVPRAALQSTRAWADGEWAAAVEVLAQRGLVGADGAFTERGRELRAVIEDQTDRAAAAAYEPLGEEGCATLRRLARPLSKAITESGSLSGLTAGSES